MVFVLRLEPYSCEKITEMRCEIVSGPRLTLKFDKKTLVLSVCVVPVVWCLVSRPFYECHRPTTGD